MGQPEMFLAMDLDGRNKSRSKLVGINSAIVIGACLDAVHLAVTGQREGFLDLTSDIMTLRLLFKVSRDAEDAIGCDFNLEILGLVTAHVQGHVKGELSPLAIFGQCQELLEAPSVNHSILISGLVRGHYEELAQSLVHAQVKVLSTEASRGNVSLEVILTVLPLGRQWSLRLGHSPRSALAQAFLLASKHGPARDVPGHGSGRTEQVSLKTDWGIFTNETAEIDQIGNLGFLDLFLSNMSFSGDYNFTFLTNHSDHNLRRTWQVITLNPISRCHHLNYNSLGIDLNQCTLEIRMDCQYPVFPLDSVHYSMFWNSSTDPTFSLPFDEPRRLERYDGSSFLAFHVQVDLRRIPVNQLQANIHLRHDKYTFQRTEEFVKPVSTLENETPYSP
eukprot:snap_masked-scaffold64_size435223-processed-gene-3.0 protein:Tk02504 transcript:snap_masked-scaffold64_size435223-processed-gene-3.0-mRNA-1 annotation:"phage small subunit"